MSAADKFTPGRRSALMRCSRDGAVLRRELAGNAPALNEIGLVEGDDGMIALTEAGKVVWTLLSEIEQLSETIKRMRVQRREEMATPPAAPEPERAPAPAQLPGALQSRGMSCGSTSTDTFDQFLARLPRDRHSHRPRGSK